MSKHFVHLAQQPPEAASCNSKRCYNRRGVKQAIVTYSWRALALLYGVGMPGCVWCKGTLQLNSARYMFVKIAQRILFSHEKQPEPYHSVEAAKRQHTQKERTRDKIRMASLVQQVSTPTGLNSTEVCCEQHAACSKDLLSSMGVSYARYVLRQTQYFST